MPEDNAVGFGTVNISGGGVTLTGNINVREAYPSLFPSGGVVRIRGGQQSSEALTQPIELGPAGDQVYLVLYGSGLGRNTTATATIGGVNAEVSYAGAQGQYPGLDQYNVLIPRSLAGRGRVDAVVTAGGHATNALPVEIR